MLDNELKLDSVGDASTPYSVLFSSLSDTESRILRTLKYTILFMPCGAPVGAKTCCNSFSDKFKNTVSATCVEEVAKLLL